MYHAEAGQRAFRASVALIRSSIAACSRSQIPITHGRITIVPRTGPFSDNCVWK
jgi:hypothetical protein